MYFIISWYWKNTHNIAITKNIHGGSDSYMRPWLEYGKGNFRSWCQCFVYFVNWCILVFYWISFVDNYFLFFVIWFYDYSICHIYFCIECFSGIYDGSQTYNSQSLPLSELRKLQLNDDDQSFMNRVKSQGMYLYAIVFI